MTTKEKLELTESRLAKAIWLLREWRDKHGGKEVHRFGAGADGPLITASQTDLGRDTQKFLEGK